MGDLTIDPSGFVSETCKEMGKSANIKDTDFSRNICKALDVSLSATGASSIKGVYLAISALQLSSSATVFSLKFIWTLGTWAVAANCSIKNDYINKSVEIITKSFALKDADDVIYYGANYLSFETKNNFVISNHKSVLEGINVDYDNNQLNKDIEITNKDANSEINFLSKGNVTLELIGDPKSIEVIQINKDNGIKVNHPQTVELFSNDKFSFKIEKDAINIAENNDKILVLENEKIDIVNNALKIEKENIKITAAASITQNNLNICDSQFGNNTIQLGDFKS